MRNLPVPQLPNPGTPHWGSSLVKSLYDWFQPAVRAINQTVGAALASAATITPTDPIHHVTGTTAIATISVPSGFAGTVTLIPDGLWTTLNTGNIAIASTAVVSKALILIYDPAAAKFYPSY